MIFRLTPKKAAAPERSESRARIEGWVRDALALDETASVTIREIVCADPACPGTETFILVKPEGGRTAAFKIAAAMPFVTQSALRAAVAAPLA